MASGAFTEDFEGYTGTSGDKWVSTPEFATSGWGDMYNGMNTLGPSSEWELIAGYNGTQGIVSQNAIDPPWDENTTSVAHLLDAPQGANSTFVFTWMWNGTGRLYFGQEKFMEPHASNLGRASISYDGDMVTPGSNEADWEGGTRVESGLDFNNAGWVEHKVEMDTNGNARPTGMRAYYRDPEGDGSWTQVPFVGTGGTHAFTMLGDDWQVEAFGLMAYRAGLDFDNINATPEPATLAVLGIGGLLALLRRRR